MWWRRRPVVVDVDDVDVIQVVDVVQVVAQILGHWMRRGGGGSFGTAEEDSISNETIFFCSITKIFVKGAIEKQKQLRF